MRLGISRECKAHLQASDEMRAKPTDYGRTFTTTGIDASLFDVASRLRMSQLSLNDTTGEDMIGMIYDALTFNMSSNTDTGQRKLTK